MSPKSKHLRHSEINEPMLEPSNQSEVNSRLAAPAQTSIEHYQETSKINCAYINNTPFTFHIRNSNQCTQSKQQFCVYKCRPLLRHNKKTLHKYLCTLDGQQASGHLSQTSLTERRNPSTIGHPARWRGQFSSAGTGYKAIMGGQRWNRSFFNFAIFCFLLLVTIICSSSASWQQQHHHQQQQQQFPSSVMLHSTATTALTAESTTTSTTTTAPSSRQSADTDTTRVADNNNRNYGNKNSDKNKFQRQQTMMANEQSQQPAFEQVAKAEALTASIAGASVVVAGGASVSSPQPVPQAAALQQQSPAKLFDVCKSQARSGQQLTNLSQIVFQPSDTCSTWSKMLRTTNSDPSSTSSDSYPWYYIEILNLSNNQLTVLHDSSGISRLVNLLELKITHNQLTRCEESSLVGLQRLQVLDLSHNKLMALPAKFFQPVKRTIKKLNLSFNSISVLVPNLFDSLEQLEHLDLSHNDITSHWINEWLFKNLTRLNFLDLSFNKLTVFSSSATFSSLSKLETLFLQHNELRQVPETIQHLRFLSSLDLSQNLIHDITNASYLSNCRLLFNLNLESNLLENITRDAFRDLPALKVLNLANNRIHQLDQQAFDGKLRVNSKVKL